MVVVIVQEWVGGRGEGTANASKRGLTHAKALEEKRLVTRSRTSIH